MNKKIIVVIVEVTIVLLFVVSLTFFYQYEKFKNREYDYKSHIKEAEQLLSESVKMAKTLKADNGNLMEELEDLKNESGIIKGDNKTLKNVNQRLREENTDLRAENQSLKTYKEMSDKRKKETGVPASDIIDSSLFVSMREKVQKISSALDAIDVNSRKLRTLESLLKDIYEEINSLDFNIAKLVKEEPLYKEQAAQKEEELQEKINEIAGLQAELARVSREKEGGGSRRTSKSDDMLEANEALMDRLSEMEDEMYVLKDKIQPLEEEKNKLALAEEENKKQLEDYRVQIEQFKKDKSSLAAELNQYRDQVKILTADLNSLKKEKDRYVLEKTNLDKKMADYKVNASSWEKEIAKLNKDYEAVGSQYEMAKQKIVDYELDLARRADRILMLQEALEEKNNSMLELTSRLDKQLKEMTGLRDDIVKVKLENAHLFGEIRDRENSFNSLKEEVKKITEINSKFKESLNRASKTFGVGIEGEDEFSEKKNSSKDVKVEIESIESKDNR